MFCPSPALCAINYRDCVCVFPCLCMFPGTDTHRSTRVYVNTPPTDSSDSLRLEVIVSSIPVGNNGQCRDCAPGSTGCLSPFPLDSTPTDGTLGSPTQPLLTTILVKDVVTVSHYNVIILGKVQHANLHMKRKKERRDDKKKRGNKR